jgi:hypothetical protein
MMLSPIPRGCQNRLADATDFRLRLSGSTPQGQAATPNIGGAITWGRTWQIAKDARAAGTTSKLRRWGRSSRTRSDCTTLPVMCRNGFRTAPTTITAARHGWISAWEETDGGNCDVRVARGGAWFSKPWVVRSSHRGSGNTRHIAIGFRLARDID